MRDYGFTRIGTPCGTWCRSRGKGAGPRKLRSQDEPYGIGHLSPSLTEREKKSLKEGTYFIQQSFKYFGECVVARGFPAMVQEVMLKASLYNLFMSLNPSA